MFIAQLHLRNFKSFGRVHNLELHPGFTGIVGPNGSGKSNLLDALRWVLGENNPSRLRITRQSDLIFQGSLSLPPGNRASVRVELQREEERCHLSRSVDESGGAVEIDGDRSRLGDLDEVKREWHLEGERFAFIGQGEVAEIVRQRPKERRLHLESLFGIDLYRKRRDEAAQRLEEALGELRNLDMLLGELSARRELLLPEAAVARKARGITEELLSWRRLFYWVRRRDLEISLDSMKGLGILQAKQEELLKSWISRWEMYLEFRQNQLGELRKRFGHRELLLGSRGNDLEGVKRRIAGVGAGFSRSRKSLKELEQELETSLKEKNRLEEEKSLLEGSFREQRHREEEVRSRYEEAKEALRGRMLSTNAVLRESEEIRRSLGECEAEESTLKGRLQGLGKRFQKLRESFRKDSGVLQEKERHFQELTSKIQRLRKEAQEAVVRHGDAYALYQGALGDLRREERTLKDLEGRLEDIRDRLQGDVYPRPVQHILGACKLGRLRAEPVVAAETFEIPGEYLQGVESYLGGRLFWLFVKSLEEARLCIEQLRKSNKGRATFLPLEQARRRSPLRKASLPSRGVCGWAADLVTPHSSWEPCVMHLLGDLLLVEDYSTGSALARSRSSFPVATLEGDVFLPSGTVSGGSTRSREGAMALRHALAVAEKDREEHARTVQELTWSVREAEDRERHAAKKKESLGEELRNAEEHLAREEQECLGCRRRFAQVQSEYEEVRELLRESGGRIGFLAAEKNNLRERLENLPPISEELEEERKVMELQSSLALAEERRKNAETLLEGHVKKARDFEEYLEKRQRDLLSMKEQMQKEYQELRKLGEEYRKLWEERKEQALFREEEGAAIRLLERRMDRGREKKECARGRYEELERNREQLFHREKEMERELDDLISLWEEEFPYEKEALKEEFSEEEKDHEALRRTIRSLERELRNLGDVNLGALSEVEALEERIGFLEEQIRDVRQGSEEMRAFIRETDRHAGALFAKALEDIDLRFNGLFQRLFGGGEARLSFGGNTGGQLPPEEDLWDAGVEVIARPPGKQPQHLGQLSGGEQSLTGISLLFAAMEIAGVPLAVLDEVDAALDEVNLQRFARLAREYSERLQMIVMTHRRYTMEKADLLYGVTMSEPGLS
ncbi:MAG TPA: chromosome segregation protein SMC, partial [Synergistaceae bacterium]|nr:chromosome segregation protein SMC [Synergistaceae bacterium]